MHPNAITICRNPVATCHNDVTDEAVRRPEPSHLSHSFVTVLRQMAEREDTAETPIKTHISLFSAIICRTVTGGRGRNPFFVVFGRESASAPRAREERDRCRATAPAGAKAQRNTPLESHRGRRRTIYPIAASKSTAHLPEPSVFGVLAGGRPPVPESRGGSPLNPFKGQGAGRSGAYNHTLFISGKSRKGEKHD